MTKVCAANFEWTFDDSDVVNPDDAIWGGEYNTHRKRLWLLHDHGFTVCVVWADSLQDALDEAVDRDKMDRYLVTQEQAADYDCDDIHNCEQLTYLGNASEPFDIGTLGYVEILPPKMSLTALYGEQCKAVNYHVV